MNVIIVLWTKVAENHHKNTLKHKSEWKLDLTEKKLSSIMILCPHEMRNISIQIRKRKREMKEKYSLRLRNFDAYR